MYIYVQNVTFEGSLIILVIAILIVLCSKK